MNRRILLDAGNSSLKWAVLEDGQWLSQGRSEYTELSAISASLTPGTACYIASVAAAAHEHALRALMQSAGVSAKWLKATARFGDLTNGYLDPEQLGVDRWMALIGARARTAAAVLVVSAGTAMTIDALSAEGQFIGGVILPGMSLMRRALAQGTARVEPAPGARHAFPRCTADAVESGVIAALCGAVDRQFGALEAMAGAPPRFLLTGGDAEALLPHLALPVEHVPLLVLEGLERVSYTEAAA